MNTGKSGPYAGPIGYYRTIDCGDDTLLQLDVVVDSEAKAVWINDMIDSLPLVGKTPDLIVIEHRNARYDSQAGKIVYNS